MSGIAYLRNGIKPGPKPTYVIASTKCFQTLSAVSGGTEGVT